MPKPLSLKRCIICCCAALLRLTFGDWSQSSFMMYLPRRSQSLLMSSLPCIAEGSCITAASAPTEIACGQRREVCLIWRGSALRTSCVTVT